MCFLLSVVVALDGGGERRGERVYVGAGVGGEERDRESE